MATFSSCRRAFSEMASFHRHPAPPALIDRNSNRWNFDFTRLIDVLTTRRTGKIQSFCDHMNGNCFEPQEVVSSSVECKFIYRSVLGNLLFWHHSLLLMVTDRFFRSFRIVRALLKKSRAKYSMNPDKQGHINLQQRQVGLIMRPQAENSLNGAHLQVISHKVSLQF